MRACSLAVVPAALSILACAGEPTPAPAPTPEVSPSPDAPSPDAPSPGRSGRGRKAAREGESLGELQFEGNAMPVSIRGTTLHIGTYTTRLPSQPFQTLLVNGVELPSVVVQYDTIDDFGPVDAFTIGTKGVERVYHGDGLSNKLVEVSGGFEARRTECGETLITRVLLQMPAPVEQQDRRGRRDPSCGGPPAACPFVDVAIGGSWRTEGEILRNLVGIDAAGPQILTLPPEAVSEGRIRVRIAERKPEISHIDAVWLEVGGRVFPPEDCDALGLCEVDGLETVLEPGEMAVLSFDVGRTRGIPRLWADGYYVPAEK